MKTPNSLVSEARDAVRRVHDQTSFDNFCDSEFMADAQEELIAAWVGKGDTAAIPTESAFGVINKQDTARPPSMVVSVDLCEVLRRTGGAICKQLTEDPDNWLNWFHKEHHEYFYNQAITSTLEMGKDPTSWEVYVFAMKLSKDLINKDLVKPMYQPEIITRHLEAIKELGGLIVANTASVTGTEVATAKWLNEHFPGIFDGLVFCREFESSGKMTKAQSLGAALTTAGIETSSLPVMHIDDRDEHNKAIAKGFTDSQVATVHVDYRTCRVGERKGLAAIEFGNLRQEASSLVGMAP